ncbi:K+/H+ antiporter subunit F [Saccharophagus sp. K07]|jgi:multicomponent K+:H+ antiporter subunit F|uniref:K+/H+ antiporter subunit F n=1 Tax=Saccharophagus sp. K07 TaxID=2283636 RepID=UPI00165217CE|nr:K+/H+ antiporter subunit F [Saccharophagus sp. K07]MBC6904373.1 K+/H+ antiporter subunit F [Saccharophagus sp. K07]
MSSLLVFAISFAQICILLAMLFCTIRLLIGPAAQDRILALDTLWMTTMLQALMMGLRFSNELYFELALLIALTGFVSSIALAKFLMRGEIIE